jgi:hypothetical protein
MVIRSKNDRYSHKKMAEAESTERKDDRFIREKFLCSHRVEPSILTLAKTCVLGWQIATWTAFWQGRLFITLDNFNDPPQTQKSLPWPVGCDRSCPNCQVISIFNRVFNRKIMEKTIICSKTTNGSRKHPASFQGNCEQMAFPIESSWIGVLTNPSWRDRESKNHLPLKHLSQYSRAIVGNARRK